jgi:hypothetical protein
MLLSSVQCKTAAAPMQGIFSLAVFPRVRLSHACRAMADTKFLKQWDEVVLKVHKLAIDPSSCTQRSFMDFESSLLPQALPPGTPRAWRKLVQDSKVRNCDDQWVKSQPMLLRQRHAVLETGRR